MALQGQDMNEKKLAVVNVRRVKYGNSPAEMPVKETQTYCTCGSKVTPISSLSLFMPQWI